jgi:XapX domain-containing protein
MVGIVYGLLNVRSPAPPVVALVGLLGILIGEQMVPMARNIWSREPAGLSVSMNMSSPVTDHLPAGGQSADVSADTKAPPETAK